MAGGMVGQGPPTACAARQDATDEVVQLQRAAPSAAFAPATARDADGVTGADGANGIDFAPKGLDPRPEFINLLLERLLVGNQTLVKLRRGEKGKKNWEGVRGE